MGHTISTPLLTLLIPFPFTPGRDATPSNVSLMQCIRQLVYRLGFLLVSLFAPPQLIGICGVGSSMARIPSLSCR